MRFSMTESARAALAATGDSGCCRTGGEGRRWQARESLYDRMWPISTRRVQLRSDAGCPISFVTRLTTSARHRLANPFLIQYPKFLLSPAKSAREDAASIIDRGTEARRLLSTG